MSQLVSTQGGPTTVEVGGTFTVGPGASLASTNQALSVTAWDLELQGVLDSGTASLLVACHLNNTKIQLGRAPYSPGAMHASGNETQMMRGAGLTLQATGLASSVQARCLTHPLPASVSLHSQPRAAPPAPGPV